MKNMEKNADQLQYERKKIEDLLENQKKRMLSLFSKQLEEQFWQDREERLTTLIVRAFVPAIAAYFIFEVISLPINYFSTEEAHRVHDVLWTMVSYTTGWLALFTIYIMARHPIWRKHYRYVVSAVILMGMTIVQVALLSTHALSMTWRGTLIISFAFMFAYLCSGLRPRDSFLAGMGSAFLAYMILTMMGVKVLSWVLFNAMILSNLVGLGLAVLSVSTERIRFLQSIIIELDKQIYEILNEHLYRLSQQDTLTMLGNRRRFEQQLKLDFNEAKQQQKVLAILFIDVDFFKFYNDLYGHQNGDIALIRVAKVLRQHIGENDVATRYGGEEFVLLLNNTSQAEAIGMGETILADIYAEKIDHAHSKIAPYLTVSIGITLYEGESGITQADVLKTADHALYEAKGKGRNRVVFIPAQSSIIQQIQSPVLSEAIL